MTPPDAEHNVFDNVRAELSDARGWMDRGVVFGYAIAAGLLVVAFTVASNWALMLFERLYRFEPLLVLAWTPGVTVLIVWITRRYFPGAAGSGIPQVLAAQDHNLGPTVVSRLVSLRLALAKIALATMGLLAGLSLGREGPSVQVAAGVMHHAGRWLGPRSGIDNHALLVAGGAAGIAAAFNAPLAGVVFAIEELSRRLESRNSGLIIVAIVVAGLVAVSSFGNLTYFGRIQVPSLDWDALMPGLLVALTCGTLGGLFSRLLAASLTRAADRPSRWRQRHPLRFAAVGGFAVACIGLATGGATFGAGSDAVKHMLAGQADAPHLYVTMKLVATWLTAWCGVPGGIFAPSLSIGAGIGHNIAELAWVLHLTRTDVGPALIAMGMAGFLAAVTQTPLTAFIIVMEMVDGHPMVLSLMMVALVASLVSRMISRPLYSTLADHLVRLLAPVPSIETTANITDNKDAKP